MRRVHEANRRRGRRVYHAASLRAAEKDRAALLRVRLQRPPQADSAANARRHLAVAPQCLSQVTVPDAFKAAASSRRLRACLRVCVSSARAVSFCPLCLRQQLQGSQGGQVRRHFSEEAILAALCLRAAAGRPPTGTVTNVCDGLQCSSKR
jgi:hypothetical protein